MNAGSSRKTEFTRVHPESPNKKKASSHSIVCFAEIFTIASVKYTTGVRLSKFMCEKSL
jgi:hypothetical protein